MVWITDDSEQYYGYAGFLDRRLENAMEISKTIGTMKTVIPNLFRPPDPIKIKLMFHFSLHCLFLR